VALKFTCKSCSSTIVVKYLKPGETAQCRHCFAENLVPEDAAAPNDSDIKAWESLRLGGAFIKTSRSSGLSQRRKMALIAVLGTVLIAGLTYVISENTRLRNSRSGFMMGLSGSTSDPREIQRLLGSYSDDQWRSLTSKERSSILSARGEAQSAIVDAQNGALRDAFLAVCIFLIAFGAYVRATQKKADTQVSPPELEQLRPAIIDRGAAAEWYNKGCAQQDKGELAEALKSYDKALQSSSQDADIWYNRAQCLVSLDRKEEAAQSLLKAAESNPADADIVFELGSLAQEAGQLDVALDAFHRFLALADRSDPQVAHALNCVKELKERMPWISQLPTSRTGFPG
jgi:tetratricopeptide (TPR) repeat protein